MQNSTLQCLASLSTVHRNFSGRAPRAGESALLAAFRDALRTLLLPGKCVTPSGLLSAVVQRVPRFRGSRQQDAQELLRAIVDGIDDDEVARMKRLAAARAAVREATERSSMPEATGGEAAGLPLAPLPGVVPPPSIVQRTFGCELVSVVICSSCGCASARTEPCFDMSLEVGMRATRGSPAASVTRAPSFSHASSCLC